jgi:hypothetical protein
VKQPTADKSYDVVRDPAGATHAAIKAADTSARPYVLVTVCKLRIPSAVASKPRNGETVSCPECLNMLSAKSEQPDA